jgi:hypothetical protein
MAKMRRQRVSAVWPTVWMLNGLLLGVAVMWLALQYNLLGGVVPGDYLPGAPPAARQEVEGLRKQVAALKRQVEELTKKPEEK